MWTGGRRGIVLATTITAVMAGAPSAGAETLETRLFSEADIPWDQLAFATVRNTLNHYFGDRKNGEYKFHMGTIEPVSRHASTARPET